MAELKKCPFCGSGVAKIKVGSPFMWEHAIVCVDCGASTKLMGGITPSNARDRAIKAWNNRVNEFDEDKYEKLVLAEMERKKVAHEQILDEMRKLLLTGETTKEIREKAIDDFVRGLKNHPRAQYRLDNYLLEDIDETAKWLKENEREVE